MSNVTPSTCLSAPSQSYINPNLGGLFRGFFFCGGGGGGGRGVGGGDKITHLKLTKIMLETSNLACKYTRICSFINIPFSSKALLILLISAFFLAKNQHSLAKIVSVLKAIV